MKRERKFTEDDLLKVTEGDRHAEDWMYGRLYTIMEPTVISHFGEDNNAVRHIIQDTIIKVFKKMHKIHPNALFNYARLAARNMCMDKFRKIKSDKKTLLNIDDLRTGGEWDTSTDVLDRIWVQNNQASDYIENDKLYDPDEVWEQLYENIDKLSPAYQKVFKLYYLDDLSHEQIGEKLGVCKGSSKSNLHKAKGKMRKMLGSYEKVLDMA